MKHVRSSLVGARIAIAIAISVVSAAGSLAIADERPAAPRPVIEKALNVSLVGVVMGDGTPSIAIIEEVATRRQRVHRLGAAVAGATITRIAPDRIVLAFPEGDVELRIAGVATAGTAPGPTARAIAAEPPPVNSPETIVPSAPGRPRTVQFERAMLDTLSRTHELVDDVDVLPAGGVKVIKVRPSGVLAGLGLRTGDVIRHVNLATPGPSAPLAAAVQQATTMSVLRVEYERDGKLHRVYADITP